MNKRQLPIVLMSALLITSIALAQELHHEGKAELKVPIEKKEAAKKLATALGIVYVGMPKEDLYKTGFTELLQKDYRQEDNEEWITFSDWTTEKSGDLITFHLIDGKVEGWQRHGQMQEKRTEELKI